MDGRERCTQDVREYAQEHGLTEDEVIAQGMEEKAVEFIEKGGEIYQKQ